MKKLSMSSFGALFLFSTGIVWCQTTSGTDTMPSPLPALIKALSGNWTLNVKFEPASGLPAGTHGVGKESWHSSVDGKTLLSEESWKTAPVEMAVLGVLWWDGKRNKLHAMDCNNQSKSVCDPQDAIDSVVVNWTGHELTIDEPERGPDGKLITSRITFENIKPDSFYEIDSLASVPGHFETVMTIRASRVVNKK